MKQAILITMYKNMDQVVEIMNHFDNDFLFFIHVDKKSKPDLSGLNRVQNKNIRLFTKYRTNWGGLNHLKAILLLSSYALRVEGIHFFHLISGQDFPAKPLYYFKEKLDLSKDYMGVKKLPISGWDGNGGLDRIEYYNFYDMFNAIKVKQQIKIEKIIHWQKILNFKRSYSPDLPPLYGGSTWWSLTRKTLESVIEYTNHKPQLLNRMKYTFCPEEIYYQTVIMKSRFAENIVNDNLRYIDWNSGKGGFPAFLDSSDFTNILRSNKIFARKFNHAESLLLKEKLNEANDYII